MAFGTITARGSAVTGSGSNSSLSMNPTGDIVSGVIAFVNCETDNSATVDGSSSDRHTVTDSQGNTWNRIAEYTETDGATDDGVCLSMWWSKIATTITTADTITLTPAVNQSDMIITCFDAVVGAGNTVAVESVDANQASLTASLAALPSREYLFIYCAGSEGEDAAKTPSASYTERFDLISSTSGSLDANICIHVATRVQTTTTSGSVASTGWTGTNLLSLLAAIYETAGLSASPITGTTAGTATVSSTLFGRGVVTGVTAGVNSSSSTLTGKGTISGTAAGVTTVSSLIFGRGILAGVTSGSTTLVGVVINKLVTTAITGITSGISTVAGLLRGRATITGVTAGTSTTTSTIIGKAVLGGTLQGVSTTSGTIYGKGRLAGDTDGETTLIGRFVGAAIVYSIRKGLGIGIRKTL